MPVPDRELGKKFMPTYGEIWRGEKRLDDVLGKLRGPLKAAFFHFT